MVHERNDDVHKSGGSTPSVETAIRELKAGTYRLSHGTYTIAGPPDVPLASVPVPHIVSPSMGLIGRLRKHVKSIY